MSHRQPVPAAWSVLQSMFVPLLSLACQDHHSAQPSSRRIWTNEHLPTLAEHQTPGQPFWWSQRNGLKPPGCWFHMPELLVIERFESFSSLDNPVAVPNLLLTNIPALHFHIAVSLQMVGGARSLLTPCIGLMFKVGRFLNMPPGALRFSP